MTANLLGHQVLGVGRRGLHALRHALERDLGEQGATTMQEAGYAAGAQVFEAFQRWLPGYAQIESPDDLDASAMDEVLSAFFEALGWGTLHTERLGAALAMDTSDWAEAEPGDNSLAPSCHFTTGLFASFLGRLAHAEVAVMEIECRSANDGRCRFLAGAGETLQEVYDGVNAGGDYLTILKE